MSTYYFLICDRHREVTDAASDGGGGIGHLANSPHTLLPFIVSHHGCSLRVISEHDPEVADDFRGYTEWTEENLEAMLYKDRARDAEGVRDGKTPWTPGTQLPPRFKNGPESVVVLAVAETDDDCLQITPAKVASFTKGEWREVRFDHDGMGRKIVVRCWTAMPALPKSLPDREAARQPAVDPSIKAAYEAGAAAERERLLSTLTPHDWRSSSIWRHYYPSATGDWVDLRELRKLLEPPNAELRGRPLADGPA